MSRPPSELYLKKGRPVPSAFLGDIKRVGPFDIRATGSQNQGCVFEAPRNGVFR